MLSVLHKMLDKDLEILKILQSKNKLRNVQKMLEKDLEILKILKENKNLENETNFEKFKDKFEVVGKIKEKIKECKKDDIKENDIKENDIKDFLRPLVKKKLDKEKDSKFVSFLKKKLRNKNIVVTSTQVPGYGGSATNCYNIFRFLKELGLNVCCVFYIYSDKYEGDTEVLIDPLKIGNVVYVERHNNKQLNSPDKFENEEEIIEKINKVLNGNSPDIVLCKNYITPLLFKKLYPNTTISYLVSGSKSLTYMIGEKEKHCNYLLENHKDELKTDDVEMKAIEVSDSICYNSLISEKVMEVIYRDSIIRKSSSILLTSDISGYNILRNYKVNEKERDVDIIYAVSNFGRIVKNAKLAMEIFSDERLAKYKKVMIGSNIPEDLRIENCFLFDKTKNHNILSILNNSKLLVLPSYYEACPNILNESLSLGCKVVLNDNIGSSERIRVDYKVNEYDSKLWVDKILDILENDKNKDFDLDRSTLKEDIMTYVANNSKVEKEFGDTLRNNLNNFEKNMFLENSVYMLDYDGLKNTNIENLNLSKNIYLVSDVFEKFELNKYKNQVMAYTDNIDKFKSIKNIYYKDAFANKIKKEECILFTDIMSVNFKYKNLLNINEYVFLKGDDENKIVEEIKNKMQSNPGKLVVLMFFKKCNDNQIVKSLEGVHNVINISRFYKYI